MADPQKSTAAPLAAPPAAATEVSTAVARALNIPLARVRFVKPISGLGNNEVVALDAAPNRSPVEWAADSITLVNGTAIRVVNPRPAGSAIRRPSVVIPFIHAMEATEA